MLTNQFIKRRARNFKRFCKLCLVQLAVQIALILCETASKDACKVEHDLSEETYSKMIAFAEKAEKEL